MEREEILTQERLVGLLGVSKRTLRRWHILYRLPAYKIGRQTIYFRSEILDFIRKQSQV